MPDMQYLYRFATETIQNPIIANDQVAYALLYALVFRGQRAALSENFQLFNGFDAVDIPMERILRGIFGYLQITAFKIIFSRGFDFHAKCLQRLIPCLASNSLLNSPSGLPCSDRA